MTRLIHTLLLTMLLLTSNVSRAASEAAAAPDSLEQLKPDYITASLLVVSPAAEPYSLFGHCALRLQCPDHKMDYCFTFETPTDAKGLYDFFRGKAMGGFAAAPTPAYLEYYRNAGRGVAQHQLNLTPKEKLMLWQHADKEIVRGGCYRYNYLHTQCASMVIDLITSVLPSPVGYRQLPAQTNGSFRDQMLTESAPYPWSRFFWQTIMGPAGDEMGPIEHKLTPHTLPEVWRQATLTDDNRHITLAYFEQRSTVDYIGAVQGFPICFDAKECHNDSFALSNVHEHQFLFMKDFEEQQGIAFLLINFTKKDKIYYMRFRELESFYNRAKNGGAKSVKISELNEAYFVGPRYGVQVHYLEGVNKDLKEEDRME